MKLEKNNNNWKQSETAKNSKPKTKQKSKAKTKQLETVKQQKKN